MTPILKPHVTVRRVSAWDQLMAEYAALDLNARRWLFRGLSKSTWGLESSLERAVRDFGHPSTSTPTIEKGLIRRFIRQSHHYTFDDPDRDHILEWLSLMQHHGAPTRIQDWTYSFFVAAFFAVDEADGESAIWALDRTVVDPAVLKLLPRSTQECIDSTGYIDSKHCFTEVFDRRPPIPLVSPVNPLRLNQRLVIQQGIFLCPGDVSLPFEQNLVAVLPSSPHDALRQIIIDGSTGTRRDILRQLHRMNMNRATLFPGLDGFARSLRTLVAFPDIIPSGRDCP